MNIYLCGQQHFGAAVLDMLIERHETIIGVSAPATPKPDGRPDRTWDRADFHNVPRYPAGLLREDTLPNGVDLIVCAHSHDFVGRKTRLKSKLGAIGYHPSLLPRHRGRDAVAWAIKMGDAITGGSVFWLSDTVDGGAIAAQDWCFVRPGDTPQTLWRRDLQPMGLKLLSRTLDDIASGILYRIPQDHNLATWEPSLDAPPLYRPDLLMIGAAPDGYTVRQSRD